MSDSQEKFVPIEEVAKHFSVSISTVRAWIRKNRIPKNTYIKLGTTYRFQISAIAKALTEENNNSEKPEQLEMDFDAPGEIGIDDEELEPADTGKIKLY